MSSRDVVVNNDGVINISIKDKCIIRVDVVDWSGSPNMRHAFVDITKEELNKLVSFLRELQIQMDSDEPVDLKKISNLVDGGY